PARAAPPATPVLRPPPSSPTLTAAAGVRGLDALASRLAFALGSPGRAAVPVASAAASALLRIALFEMTVIGGLDVGDVQEAVPPDAEIDKGCLDARLDVDDSALVDVADVTFV